VKHLLATLILGWLLACSSLAQRADQDDIKIRFQTVDIFVDSNEQPLAAYQLEMVAESGEVRIAGIEGGEHAAFKSPPTTTRAPCSGTRSSSPPSIPPTQIDCRPAGLASPPSMSRSSATQIRNLSFV